MYSNIRIFEVNSNSNIRIFEYFEYSNIRIRPCIRIFDIRIFEYQYVFEYSNIRIWPCIRIFEYSNIRMSICIRIFDIRIFEYDRAFEYSNIEYFEYWYGSNSRIFEVYGRILRIFSKFGKIPKRCFSDRLGPEKHESVNEKFPKFRFHAEKWQKRRKSGFGEKRICLKVKEVRGWNFCSR